MRILQIPQVSNVEVLNESDMATHRQVQRALRSLEPSFFYSWLRRADERKVKDEPDVKYLFDDTPALAHNFYTQQAGANLDRLIDLFSWQRGYYPIDAVFTSRVGIAPLLSLALAGGGCQYPMPIVLTEPRVYGPGEHGHNQSHPVELAIRAAGYAVCYGMYFSKYEKASALDAAQLICAPGVVKGFEERSFVVDWPVDIPMEIREMPRRKDRKRLIFCGRLNSNKKWTEIVESYAKVMMSRSDTEVWIHAGTGAYGKVGEPEDNRWHRTSERLPHREFIELMGGAHVGAYMSDNEGICVTPQEMLLAGIVMALPDKLWARRMFDPLPYPFLVKNFTELPALLDWMLDNYDEAYARLAPIRNMIATERSWEAFRGRFEKLFEAVKAVPRPDPYRAFLNMAREATKTSHQKMQLPFSTLLSLTKGSRDRPFTQYRGSYASYLAVRHLDTMDSADPILDLGRDVAEVIGAKEGAVVSG